MKILDLFAGIGGFSLAAHWMGWETAAFVEWEEYPQKVLKKNFPNTPIYGDIREFDGTKYRGKVDIITGGFPCQPFSSAGKRNGRDDDRYLWPEMLRVIREVQPTWIVGENVAGILSMDDGAVFEEICAGLEKEGYALQAFIIPACAKGAPHGRDRVWIIANATGRGQQGSREHRGRLRPKQNKERKANFAFDENQFKKPWPEVAARLCRVDDGVSRRMDRHRAYRLKALGNAIVPQVAYQIFKAIEA